MAVGQIFSISKSTAKGYNVPSGRPLRANGDGVTTLMGIAANPGKMPARDSKGRFVPRGFDRSPTRRDDEGRFTSRARRNPEESPMLVFDSFEENRRSRKGKGRGKSKSRGKRRGKGRSSKAMSAKSFLISPKGKSLLRAVARRNGEFDASPAFDFGGEFEENRRSRRGRKSSKKSRRGYAKKSRRGYGKSKVARASKRVLVRRSGRGLTAYARNAAPFGQTSPSGPGQAEINFLFRKYQVAARSGDWAGAVAALTKVAKSRYATSSQRTIAVKALTIIRSKQASGRLGVRPRSERVGSFGGGGSSLLPIWYRPKAKKPRPPAYTPEAVQALRAGVKPRDLFKAMRGLSEEQAANLFGDYGTFNVFMRSMMGTKRVRRYMGKFKRGSYRYKGKKISKLSRLLKSLRRGRGKGRRGYAKGRRGYAKGRRGYSKGRRGYAKGRRHGKGRGRRYNRWGYKRNEGFEGLEMMENASGKEIAFAVLAGLGGWGLGGIVSAVANMFDKQKTGWGSVIGAAVGVGVAYLAGKAIFDNPMYEKGMIAGSIIPLALTGYGKFVAPKGASGFGVDSVPMDVRYALAGQIQQAMAGRIQQASAGFQQAAAGYGDYYTPEGVGEYVSRDVSPVGDFGEYEARSVQVQGWGDYEIVGDHSRSADGFGLINDGVRPGGDLDSEFAMMEAAAGVGASPVSTASDYLPTSYAQPVSNTAGSQETGIFDGFGANGIFG